MDTIITAIEMLQNVIGNDFKATDIEVGVASKKNPLFRKMGEEEIEKYLATIADKDWSDRLNIEKINYSLFNHYKNLALVCICLVKQLYCCYEVLNFRLFLHELLELKRASPNSKVIKLRGNKTMPLMNQQRIYQSKQRLIVSSWVNRFTHKDYINEFSWLFSLLFS